MKLALATILANLLIAAVSADEVEDFDNRRCFCESRCSEFGDPHIVSFGASKDRIVYEPKINLITIDGFSVDTFPGQDGRTITVKFGPKHTFSRDKCKKNKQIFKATEKVHGGTLEIKVHCQFHLNQFTLNSDLTMTTESRSNAFFDLREYGATGHCVRPFKGNGAKSDSRTSSSVQCSCQNQCSIDELWMRGFRPNKLTSSPKVPFNKEGDIMIYDNRKITVTAFVETKRIRGIEVLGKKPLSAAKSCKRVGQKLEVGKRISKFELVNVHLTCKGSKGDFYFVVDLVKRTSEVPIGGTFAETEKKKRSTGTCLHLL